MSDRLPSNLAAEQAVLGAVLMSWETEWPSVSAALSPDDFSVEKHRRIFARMGEVYAKGDGIDRVTVANELISHGQLESVDGLSYLVSLDEGLPQNLNIDSYVRIVKDKATLRRMILAAQKVSQKCMEEDDDPLALAALAQATFARISEGATERQDALTASGIIAAAGGPNEFWSRRDTRREVPIPWQSVRGIVGGFKAGQLITLAARPGVGKSVAAANMAVYASQRGYLTVLFSLEMGPEELLIRSMASEAQVDGRKFGRGYADRDELARMRLAAVDIEECGVRIVQGGSSVEECSAVLHRLKAKGITVSMAIIDYLQLMRGTGENRNTQVASLSTGLKRLARTMGIPIVALSQLTRAPSRENRPPVLPDLRDSGAIEQDSDVVAFLHQEQTEFVQQSAMIDFIVAKQRNGPLGTVPLRILKQYSRIVDPAGVEG